MSVIFLSFLKIYLFVYFIYMGVLSTSTFAHQKRASDPMGLQLEMVMSHHADAGN